MTPHHWSTTAPGAAAPILVIDDEEETRGELREALAFHGREVIEAINGREALELLTSQRMPEPCLILLDLRMPIMTGWEFLTILRSYHRLARIPVIVVSGADDAATEMRAPLVQRIRKPFSADVLLAAVDATLHDTH